MSKDFDWAERISTEYLGGITFEELYQAFAERFRRENTAQGEINPEPLGWQMYELVETPED